MAPVGTAETTACLLQRARTGDEAAIEHLFARCFPALSRWARGRLPRHARDLAETQDLVQETLMRTFKNLDNFEHRGEGALQAYLRQALMNRLRDEVRRVGRRGEHDELPETLVDREPSPLEALIGRDATERYERALDRLKPDDREALILRLELGYSYEQLTEALGKPSVGAARKTLERAVVRLAVEMDR